MNDWLLGIIRCPITSQPLQLAGTELVEQCGPKPAAAICSVTKALRSSLDSMAVWSTNPNRISIASRMVFRPCYPTKPSR